RGLRQDDRVVQTGGLIVVARVFRELLREACAVSKAPEQKHLGELPLPGTRHERALWQVAEQPLAKRDALSNAAVIHQRGRAVVERAIDPIAVRETPDEVHVAT